MDRPYKNGKYNYDISPSCLQSYPCQHDVMDRKTGIIQTMSGVTIYKMLKKDRLSYPHFDMYSSYN